MTTQSPRIYTYKITFDEVPYYYYGAHKEKRFNEVYWGSPKTNKWCWSFYTPKKQILEIFEFSDDGWLDALNVESRIIKYFYNDDQFCLNKCYGGIVSLDISRKTGKKVGIYVRDNCLGIFNLTKEEKSLIGKKGAEKSRERGVGIFGLTRDELVENGKKAGKLTKELGKGIFAMSPEEKSEAGRKGGKKAGKYNKENGRGIFSLTREQMSENGKKAGKIGGKKAKELEVGIFALSKEELSNNGKKGGNYSKENNLGLFAMPKEQKSELARKVNLQRWKCTETDYVSTAAGLSNYQKSRGIDATKRIRIE